MYIRHIGPPIYHPWWSFAGAIFLLLLFAAVVGLLIWAVLRLTRERPAQFGGGWRGLPPGQRSGGRPDVALEHARYRYARGEIGREEFIQISSDLGVPFAAPPPPPAPPQDPAHPTAGEPSPETPAA
jgi:uncharacterized membrane protein